MIGHYTGGVFEGEVAAGAGGVAAGGDISAGEGGQSVDERPATGSGGHRAAIEQDVGIRCQMAGPTCDLHRAGLEGSEIDRLARQADAARLAVANNPQAGDRRLPGQAGADLADGIAGRVESEYPCPSVLRHWHLAGNVRAKYHQRVGHIKQLGQGCNWRRVQAAFQVLNDRAKAGSFRLKMFFATATNPGKTCSEPIK